MNKKVSYSELTIGFLVILIFVVSVSVAVLSQRTDRVEDRVDHVERTVSNISHPSWK